jgi:hypothetical protein
VKNEAKPQMRNLGFHDDLGQDSPKWGRKTKPTSRVTLPGHALCMSHHGKRHGLPSSGACTVWTVDRGPYMQDARPLPTLRVWARQFCFRHTAYRQLATVQAVYTGGHLLEFHRKTAISRNFSARPARLADGMARSASRVMRSRSGLTRGFPGDPYPSLQGHPQNCNIKFRLLFTIKNRRNRSCGTITLASVCHCGIHF